MWALILSSAAALLSLVAFWYAYQAARHSALSVPSRCLKAVEDLGQRVLTAEENVGLQQTRMTTWRTEMDAMLEAVDGQLDRIERKRKSAAASAAKLEAAEKQNGGPPADSDAALIERAVRMGVW